MSDCVMFLVIGIGKEKHPAYMPAGIDTNIGAQAEVDTGKNGPLGKDGPLAGKDGPLAGKDGPLTGPDGKPIAVGDFERGILQVKGEFVTDRIGGHSFLSLDAARGWLDSKAGWYFTSRMSAVLIIATNACGPDLTKIEFISTSR